MGWCVSRSVPEGSIQWQFEFPFVTFIKVGGSADSPPGLLSTPQVVMTSDEHHLVCYDADKLKPNLYIHRSVALRNQG